MLKYKVVTSPEQALAQWEQYEPLFSKWTHNTLAENIRALIKAGTIEASMPEFDAQKRRWDGTLLVSFRSKPDPVIMVNQLIFWANADEIHMLDEKTLRLWWD